MESTTFLAAVRLPLTATTAEPSSLYLMLSQLTDPRHRRGRRYSLALILTLLILAKLAGETKMSGIAQWARLRTDWLCAVFQLPRQRLPCANTYTLVAAQVNLAELNALLAAFFASSLKPVPPSATSPKRASRHLALDGKTLRGTRCGGRTPRPALHQLGLYDVTHRVMLAQQPVVDHEHEGPAARELLRGRDLRGCVVTADALHTQRSFCAQVVAQGGDYVLVAKGNQAQLRQDIAFLFDGPWPRYLERRSTATVEKGHGRLEVRELHASAELNELLAGRWAGVQQVFQLERSVTGRGRGQAEVVVGLTSLPGAVATPAQLLAVSRAHWHLENRGHWRRDVTLGEDASRVRTGQAPHVLAALNMVVLALLDHYGVGYLPAQMRTFCANPAAALALLLTAP
jgi:predicted transposase YbfD/YdcC